MQRSTTPPSNESIAIYIRIASVLKGRILNGEWPAGTQVPGVEQLSKTYGVARATARQALQRLVAEGLISSERGRGSHVSYQAPPAQDIEDGLFRALTPLAGDHRIRLLSREHGATLPAGLVEGASDRDPYVKITKVHLQGGLPYGYFEVFVADEVYRQLPPGADERNKIIMLMIDAGVPAASGEETLTAHGADWEQAQHLDYQMAMPVIRITRVLRDHAGRVLYAAVNNYRGDRFRQHRKFVGYFHGRSPAD